MIDSPITIQNDLSANTLIVSLVFMGVGWGLKKVLKFSVESLIAAIKSLIAKLTETIGRVEILDTKMETLTRSVGDHEKLRGDLQVCFTELKKLKVIVEELQNH
jgi:hypothetical protein